MSIKATIWDVALAAIMGGIGLYVLFRLAVVSNANVDVIWNGSHWVERANASAVSTAYGTAGNWSLLGSLEFTSNVSLLGLVLVIGLVAAVIVKTKLFD